MGLSSENLSVLSPFDISVIVQSSDVCILKALSMDVCKVAYYDCLMVARLISLYVHF